MSEPRRLWMRFRRVDSAKRADYRSAVAAAGVQAGEIGAHFWAFEADGEDGLFVEFLEGPEDEILVRVDRRTSASLAVGGPLRVQSWPAIEGLRSTQFGDP